MVSPHIFPPRHRRTLSSQHGKFVQSYYCPRRRTFHLTSVGVSMSFGDDVKRVLIQRWANHSIARVLESWNNALEGIALENDAGTTKHQRAESFVRGLKAVPFHSLDDHAWFKELSESWESVNKELQEALKRQDLKRVGNNVWVGPIAAGAEAYGPEWKTLVLKDRRWDEVNSKLFPKTRSLLEESPAVEVFFARQGCQSGIDSHTDGCNFLLTGHLPLLVENGKAWIEVGGERRYWEEGKPLVFDTSFFHRTKNESTSTERYILLIRFWHPELSAVERDALAFIFAVIDNPKIIEQEINNQESRDTTHGGYKREKEHAIHGTRSQRRAVKRKRKSERPQAQGFG